MVYVIQQRRYYYGGTLGVTRGWEIVRRTVDGGQPYYCPTYPTIRAARAAIRMMGSGTYYLSYGEYGRPDYRVRRYIEPGS